VFTETWLKQEILSSKVFPSKYTTYRLDRPSRRVGGVLTAVDSELRSEVITSDEINDIYFTSENSRKNSDFPKCFTWDVSLAGDFTSENSRKNSDFPK